MDMEERKGMAEHIFFRDLPDANDVLCVLDQVLLSKDGSLGLACGAGCIDKNGWIVRISPLK